MLCDGPLTLARSDVPDLKHPIFGTRDSSQRVRTEPPYSLRMSEESLEAATRSHVPELHRRIECSREHMGRGTTDILGEDLRVVIGTGGGDVSGIIHAFIFVKGFQVQREALLDVADMTGKCSYASSTRQVPHFHGRVVRSGEEGVRGAMDPNGVDPVGMAAEDGGPFIVEVPEADGSIDATGGQELALEVKGYDTGLVTSKDVDALTRPPVPDPKRVVQRSTDELRFVELQSSDAVGVSSEGSDLGSCFDVPDLDGPIVRTGGNHGVIELDAHDAVFMALKDLGLVSAPPPVRFDLVALGVDVLPKALSSFLEIQRTGFFDDTRGRSAPADLLGTSGGFRVFVGVG